MKSFVASIFLIATAYANKPNILFILGDDLGYSDLGCYGGEIKTPNLDSLARGGLRITQFYNTARCWPSRAALMTGYYAQQVNRDKLPGINGGGTQGNRPSWARMLPDFLAPLGYRSYHSGKWHLDGNQQEAGFLQLARDARRYRSIPRHLPRRLGSNALNQEDCGPYLVARWILGKCGARIAPSKGVKAPLNFEVGIWSA